MTTTLSGAGLRPVRASDRGFLRELYVATHAEGMTAAGLPTETVLVVLAQQFEARERSFAAAYPEKEQYVVQVDGAPVGRMTVANLVTELRLVDIAVLPRQANQGIGTALLEDLLARAREAGLPVTLHVDLTNPARHLYERLGFVSVSVDELRTLMRYDPPEWTAQETPKPGSKP